MKRRAEKLRRFVVRGMPVMEIGPSFAPIIPRRDGWDTFIVDHLSREDLIAKYEGHDDRLDAIEAVDAVWDHGPLDQAVPSERHGTFRVILASHVIEHIADLLSFFRSAERLLSPGGVVSLAVPDKRFCFDFYKPISTAGDVVAAAKDGASRHGRRTIFNHFAYSVMSKGKIMWGQDPLGALQFVNTLDQAADLSEKAAQPDAPYIDCHAWHFTPASFELMMLELKALGLTGLSVDEISEADGCEFIAHLRSSPGQALSPEALSSRRLALLDRTLLEAEQQIKLSRKRLKGAKHDRRDA